MLTHSHAFQSINYSGTTWICSVYLDNHDLPDYALDENDLARSYVIHIASSVLTGLPLHFFRGNYKMIVRLYRFSLVIHTLHSKYLLSVCTGTGTYDEKLD